MYVTVSSRNSLYSPHAWGCPAGTAAWSKSRKVFPICVGVPVSRGVPPAVEDSWERICIPYMRRGVPEIDRLHRQAAMYSQRRWGVNRLLVRRLAYRKCIPYTRRGGPCSRSCRYWAQMSSPHVWGCPDHRSGTHENLCVFPTCVGDETERRNEIWLIQKTDWQMSFTAFAGRS
jgi:hypothetical protein